MGNSTDQRAAGEALGALEAAFAVLAAAPQPGLHAERLTLISRLRKLSGQVQSLAALWVAQADRDDSAGIATGTSMTQWMMSREKAERREAAGQVKAGQDLLRAPELGAAALAGEITPGQARGIKTTLDELPKTLTPEQRQRATGMLLESAKTLGPRDLAKQAGRVLEAVAPEQDPGPDAEFRRLAEQRRRAFRRRAFRFHREDGSLNFSGSIPVLEGESFVRLLEAGVASARSSGADRRSHEFLTHEQRYADALIGMVAAADGAGSAPPNPPRPPHVVPSLKPRVLTLDEARASDGARASDEARSSDGQQAVKDNRLGVAGDQGWDSSRARWRGGTVAGDRPRIVVTMSEESLRERAEQAGVLGSGEKIDPGSLRRLCCDADITPVVLGSDSVPLDVGRTSRLVKPELRRALSVRDGGCVFPECDAPDERCEAHHIVPWWAEGRTAMDNLVLLCPHHHAVVEPNRFWRGPPPDRWEVRIGPSGMPEFKAPERLGIARDWQPVRRSQSWNQLARPG